jgi:hypothetical protein
MSVSNNCWSVRLQILSTIDRPQRFSNSWTFLIDPSEPLHDIASIQVIRNDEDSCPHNLWCSGRNLAGRRVNFCGGGENGQFTSIVRRRSSNWLLGMRRTVTDQTSR